MTEMKRPDLDAMRLRMDAVIGNALLTYAERLEKEVERLRALVRPAYFEGWQDCVTYTERTVPMHEIESDWDDSDARAALNEQEADQ
jgi:hypothetical protein